MKSASRNVYDHFGTSPYFQDPCVSGAVVLAYYYPAVEERNIRRTWAGTGRGKQPEARLNGLHGDVLLEVSYGNSS
jgi:hypothetical protein